MRFAKGHGTENDFVILPDPYQMIDLTADLAARLCDRRAGLGADGVLRAVRGEAGSGAGWFMDYRNADGSLAEMCGNGIRVFGRYLLDHELAEGPEFAVATLAGTRRLRAEPDGTLTVDMGAPEVLGPGRGMLAGQPLSGLAVSLGNPHLACVVDQSLDEFDLSQPPALDGGQFPDGANLELIRVIGEAHVEMRVYERGSGPTRSCGTGAVAAAVAAAALTQPPAAATAAAPLAGDTLPLAGDTLPPAGDTWTVDVPGGCLRVTLGSQTSLLSGPAVIVAEGELDEAWLAGKTVTTGQSSPAA